MTDLTQVVVVRGAITSTDAVCLVSALTGDAGVKLAAEVIYPYYCFDANCSVPTMAGRKDLPVVCLVDAVNGLGATVDRFALRQETVNAGQVLSVELDDAAAATIARRTVTHRIGRKSRMIASFNVSLSPRGMLHKRFWIVQSSEAKVMVDSTTGSLHPLKLRAA